MPDLKPKISERDIHPSGPASGGIGVVGMIALVIAGLFVGREVFVPVALAILLSFVLAPLIRLLQKLHVPRALAVIGVVLVAFAGDYGTRHRHGDTGHPTRRRLAALSAHDAREGAVLARVRRRQQRPGARRGRVAGPRQGTRQAAGWRGPAG